MITPAHAFLGVYTGVVAGVELAVADLDFIKAAEEGGLVVIALGIVYVLLKRSDTREDKLRETLQKQLKIEQEAHEKTREQLLAFMQEGTGRKGRGHG